MNITLSNKTILITGGTGALGRAFVESACKEGAQVFFTYFRHSEEAKRLETLGAKGFHVDLAQRSEIDRLVRDLSACTMELDAVIHNAAIVRDKTLANLSTEDWDEVLAVNLDAVYYLTKQLLPIITRKPGAKILNIVSRVGLRGNFGQVNYAAAKGGLIALTKTLAKELGRKGILVNGLNPGFMKSELTKGLPEDVIERNVKESPLRTISDPKEVSDFLIYLLSDHVQHVTGQIFHYDSRSV
ncbi:MAG: hypothetical protein A3G33_09310 [Omnitrophica bacterium RIFCSPLOWO2_12_FULL_44_17]|uniref:Ketoreductase domain-containing protein n=1 Tax=Candidatus Danuiimicrobium aquiferis TaxID=1801832 RepID=A0A1G1KX51_9BACT|nr:MAG: hypothetical protein A3B72_10050 [Omnitrophica bacterium RIFCSPHIGHO2_02_FULL_45_28]OGW92075.1 MAG: hypothetical protein A3E74_00090 [Omnitrophica bacterium RIFCSPHIGHO2_12_FULL_44_12]OGW97382.1 MAG: hypothetical protein A3G33_09310 [Omnitrophica bacterium RIFCSPLOWO2_12_FULL_44_17]OGX04455.1 MAG: hypothetical protein A3J12_10345 [Omnitrophica bacterium RIFCSPLOWO2_02_FULL_44_11]